MKYVFSGKVFFFIFLVSILVVSAGCAQVNGKKGAVKEEVVLSYEGEIFEAPLYAAVEKGYFEEEGLKVELVKDNYESFRKKLSGGLVDGATCDYRIFAALQEGDEIQLVAGLNNGCTKISVPKDSAIKSIKDLKNKKIGVEAYGDGPMVITSRLLESNGIDPSGDVAWKVYTTGEAEKAVKNGEVDAIAGFERTDTKENSEENGFRLIYSSSGGSSGSHSHEAYKHFFESFIGIRKEIITEEPEKAQKIARAWLNAARWVSENQKEAVVLAVDKGYVTGSYESNDEIMGNYMWMPGVKNTANDIEAYIKQQKNLKIIPGDCDEKKLAKNSFAKILPDLSGW